MPVSARVKNVKSGKLASSVAFWHSWPMRLIVADCEVAYSGRLTAHLPPARRLIMVKADGTVIVHCDRGHKALNWMSPPCRIVVSDEGWIVYGAKGEVLDITMTAIVSDVTLELGDDPGLRKTGSELELQALLAASPEVIEEGVRLIKREFPTDLGPIDLLLRDASDRVVAVEVKRVAELQAVEQLSRYIERLDQDPTLVPVRGIIVAQSIKPQTRVLATARGFGCVEVDFEILAGRAIPDLTLF